MEHILPFAAEEDLLPREGVILCALSGGGDSVALVHFLKTHGFQVEAAHFNHLLRPTAADDAALAGKLCREWEVPFHYGEGAVGEKPGNVEANGRAMRYAFLRETAARIGAVRIATAHTASDNLETVLLHLTRGCGLKGLCGIAPRQGLLVRPMLRTTRRGVEAYLEEHHLPYATDETNFDETYARNRIRRQVVPVLESLNPRVTETAARMTDLLRADEALLEALAQVGDPADLPEPLRYRREERPTVLPPILPRTFEPGERVDGPVWILETWVCPAPPGEPTPEEFYLRRSGLGGPFLLRPRRTGDRLRPPNRTGKTVKKWMNELAVPPEERERWPVVESGGAVIAGAGIGPRYDLIASPGEEAVGFRWTKKTREKEGDRA